MARGILNLTIEFDGRTHQVIEQEITSEITTHWTPCETLAEAIEWASRLAASYRSRGWDVRD